MPVSPRKLRNMIVAGIALASLAGFTSSRAEDASSSIGDNAGVFIDGKTFQIVPGRPAADAASRIDALGARALGPGAIIFRSGDKLYIVDSPPAVGPGGAQPVQVEANSKIAIEYAQPKNPEHQKVFDLIKQARALEIVQQVFSPFELPVEMTIKTVGCDGVSNAWYQREGKRPTVSLCYEYLQELLQGMPKETTAAGITPQDALAGQLVFAAFHEMGHATFDIFDVPIFGRQEDAADQFATYLMLQFGGDRAHRLIQGAAYSYREFIKGYKQKPNVTLPLTAFSSDHGSPEVRFYNLLCIAYGYDAKEFANVVEQEYLPKTRAKNCDFEYQDLRFAFRQMISPHVDKEQARKVLDTKWLAPPRSRVSSP